MRYGYGYGIPASLPIVQRAGNAVIAPDQVTSATLQGWFRVPESIQLGTTLTAGGTSPPAVTLTTSGTFVGRTEGVFVDIIVGGSRGTATLKSSIDNGMSFLEGSPVTTAATYLMPGTNLTLNFPIGTYNANNTYDGICSTWLDKVGAYPSSTNNFINDATDGGTTTRPIIRATGNLGAPCLRFDGSNDFLWNTAGSLATQCSGTDKTYFRMMLVDFLAYPSAGTNATFFSTSNLTDTDLPQVFLAVNNTGGVEVWRGQRRSDTGSATNKDSAATPGLGQALIEDYFNGSTLERTITVNTADQVGGDSGVSGLYSSTTITTTRSVIGCVQNQSGKSFFGNFDLYQDIFLNTKPSAHDLAGLRAYFLV